MTHTPLSVVKSKSCHARFPGSSMVEHSAVNRNVGGSNPPRGANSLVIQRVANILRESCPSTMKCRVRELQLISIYEDEGKSTRAGVSEVDQINRGQPRSIALKPSIRLATECSPISRWVGGSACLSSSGFAEDRRHRNVITFMRESFWCFIERIR